MPRSSFISRNALDSTAELWSSPSSISSQTVVGSGEQIKASQLPCKVVSDSASRLATALGAVQEETFTITLLEQPLVEVGDIFVFMVNGKRLRYKVKTVRQLPSPVNCRYQVASCSRDIVSPE